MARVIISAGHTSRDPGATFNGLQEVTFTRKIANEVILQLRKKNLVTLSVPYELDLAQRIDWINKTGYSEINGDIAIEIHINDGGKSGLEAWYKDDDDNRSKRLAEKIIKTACEKTGLENQGAKSEFQHALKSLAFVNQVYPTGVILECLYLDNPIDQDFLQSDDKIKELAVGIVDGIYNFFTDPDDDDILEDFDIPDPLLNSPLNFPNTPPIPTTYPNFNTQNPFPAIGSFGVDRDGRKQMIEQTYQMILGKLPTMQETNYFINSGVTQDALIKKMVESQEHLDMVNAAREAKDAKKQKEEMEMKTRELEISIEDKTKIIDNLNFLIEQKNQTIHNLEDMLQNLKVNRMQLSQFENSDDQQVSNNTPSNYNQESRLDRILSFLNRVFG